MLAEVKSKEVITRLCPLGVRFWDDATGRTMADGLQVIAYPKISPAQRTAALANRSGIQVFSHLPFLRDVENGAGDEPFWASSLAANKREFVVEMTDAQGRFLPCRFDAELPAKGVFAFDRDLILSPPESPLTPPVSALAHVPLFSAPQRAPVGGLAVLRAELADSVEEQPAAWAVLMLSIDVPLRDRVRGIGVADERGSVVVMFPYPEPEDAFPDSPLHNGRPLTEQKWKTRIEIFYRRPPTTLAPPTARKRIPDLRTILDQRLHPAATIITDLNSPAMASAVLETTLEFGREAVVRTAHSTKSKLIVIPAV